MIRLYDYLPSGNGYKVRLLLTQLQIPFERIELDIIKGSTRTGEFLRKFPNGRIPAVEFDDGRRLFESNAIMWHFAETSPLVPKDPFERARALQWMFFEQYSHEPYIAVARFFAIHPAHPDERRAGLARIIKGGYDALGVMESHLGGGGEGDHAREFFVGGKYSIADIALFPWLCDIQRGVFYGKGAEFLALADYTHVARWLAEIEVRPAVKRGRIVNGLLGEEEFLRERHSAADFLSIKGL